LFTRSFVKYAFLPLQQVLVYKLTSKQAYQLVSAILQRIKLMRNVLRSLTQSIRCHIANIWISFYIITILYYFNCLSLIFRL